MNIVIDACSFINLCNGGTLNAVYALQHCRLWICAGAASECQGEYAIRLIEAVDGDNIKPVSDESASADRVLDLLGNYGLGLGETESIATAERLNFTLCSDDGAARKLGLTLLGNGRVVGSIRLLRWCVEERLLTCEAAYSSFRAMKQRGGFLPSTRQEFFCSDLDWC